MAPALPQVELVPIRRIDRRLGELDDRSQIIALYQLGWAGLVTNNYKMLYVPAEIVAIVKTKLLVFAVEGVGHDPLRATGALLFDLPGVFKRYRPGTSQVFRVTAFGFADWGEDPGAEVSLVADGVGGVEDLEESGLAQGAGIVGASGQRVGKVQEPAVQGDHHLVVVAGGVVLARVQLGRVGSGPAGRERAVQDGDPAGEGFG